MNAHDENRIKQLLKQTLPPVASNAGAGTRSVARRVSGVSTQTERQRHAVPWFDWALLGGLAVFAVSFPATIPVFLYYL